MLTSTFRWCFQKNMMFVARDSKSESVDVDVTCFGCPKDISASQ